MTQARKNIKILFRGFVFLFKIEKMYAVLHIITSALSPLKPYFNIYMTAMIINAIEQQRSIENVLFLSLATVLLNFIFDIFLSYLNRKKTLRMEQFYKSEQMFFAEHAMLMKYKFIEDANVYNLRERVKSESQCGYNMFYLNIFSGQLISSIATIIGATSLSVELFARSSGGPAFLKVLIVAIAFLTVAANYYTTKSSNKENLDMYNKLVPYNSLFNFYSEYNENYNAGKDIRIYNLGAEIAERLSIMNSNAGDTILETKKSILKFVILQIVNTEFLNIIMTAFVISICMQGDIGIGDITKYVSSIMLLTGGISEIIQNYQTLINNNCYLENYFSYFDIPEEDVKCNNEFVQSREGYTIEFKNVCFSYPNTNFLALKNVSFIINPGEKIAVVGKNGSGKTTMIKLLCRLYEPDSGDIYINDQNIKDFGFKEYIKILSVVFQDYKLFSFSLKQNIVLADEYCEMTFQEAIEKAGLKDFVEKNIGGVETLLFKDFDENGIEISGGEGQKVAIARALYRMSDVMVLDEPTAALDPASESEIYQRINSIVDRKTAIFVSHRMAACMFCDKIFVFENGELVQNGNHKTLLKESDKIYHELWSSQVMYYE